MFGFGKIRSISADELADKLKQNKTQLLDVREPGEYARGHIKGSRNLPVGQIEAFTAPENTKVYVICQSGARSKKAYKTLEKKGFDVTNVKGGMMAWREKTV
ncbi:rhodanese-like domain-containing protein [Lactococcus ileimucosae]|uniref:rhodanese-like domain-containing protein n=1 Tax=Lactococcus ileimucosae TaxID=2941329 RepID=UPI002042C035|nr:rhodanese-like domain-containing protein [Lactococcus ileimucosae]